MPPRHTARFTLPTCLHIIDEVASDLLMGLGNGCPFPKRHKRVVLFELGHLEFLRVCPIRVSVPLVDLHGLVVVSGNLLAILVDRFVSEVAESDLVDGSRQEFRVLHNFLEVLPSLEVEKVMLVCIHCQCHGIIP